MKKQTKWWASGGGIAVRGPYGTQEEAYASMRHAQDQKTLFPADLVVWPSSLDEYAEHERRASAVARKREDEHLYRGLRDAMRGGR